MPGGAGRSVPMIALLTVSRSYESRSDRRIKPDSHPATRTNRAGVGYSQVRETGDFRAVTLSECSSGRPELQRHASRRTCKFNCATLE